MSKLSVVVGGQFGSEGKGAIAAYLTKFDKQAYHESRSEDVIAVRVAGPNAGHTVIGRCPPSCQQSSGVDTETGALKDAHTPSGHAWKLRQVPVAAVSNPDAQLVIAAGSEIDIPVLRSEIDELDAAGYDAGARLIVDKSATIIEDNHKALELEMFGEEGRSTAKGIGAARADRIMRTATVANNVFGGNFIPGDRIDTAKYLRSMQSDPNAHIVIEGTQGYGLGLHTEFYPFTTSSDCRAMDFMAMAGVSPWADPTSTLDIWVVFRVRPIRIAGNSGPLDGETKWAEIGRPDEFTTVTQKVRRVGSWNPALARDAIHANGGGVFHSGAGVVKAALTMVDHQIPAVEGWTDMNQDQDTPYGSASNELDLLIKEKEADLRAPIMLVGTGPSTIIDLR